MLKFDLNYKKKTFVRWNNWQEFLSNIEKINYKNDRKIALFFLTYNLSNSVIQLIDKLNKDPSRALFDIIIIDNHSESTHTELIKNDIINKKIKNVIYLYTIDNI